MALEYKFCPLCAKPLQEIELFHAVRKACPDREGCGFILFLEPKLVGVVLVEHEGKLLLGKRAMNPSKGLWSFPGGYIDRYEKVEEAAVREVKEETNLDIELKGLLGIYSENGDPVVLLVFRAEPVSPIEEMEAQPDEVTELGFFDPDHLPPMAFSSEVKIMRDWRAIHFSENH